ncbi:MAG: helix-turn-helix domain-containing protein [Cyanobacteria bacterium HKST-UBA02]|nr:helix-turn-helix domain-containing protein [Cyanobacteria bacterium HKST-UBA02]
MNEHTGTSGAEFSGDLNSSGDQLLSRKEAAGYLGVSPQTLAIWHCTSRYPLPVVKIGRLAKYRKSDLDSFIESRTVEPQKRVFGV